MSSPPLSPNPRSSIRLSRQSEDLNLIDLPERFKYDEDEDVAEEEDAPESEQPEFPFMHQSVFGVIAATHSKDDYNSLIDQGESGDESQGEAAAAAQLQSQYAPSAWERGKAPQPISGESKAATASSSPRLRPLRPNETIPRLSPAHSPSFGHRKGGSPTMSQMVQARAQAEDLQSSVATLTAKPSTSSSTSSLRRTKKSLPEALKDIFNFEQPEDVISEYPCWYLANVLLQGYMYITQRHVLFYAYVQQKNHRTVKSGFLSKRGKTNPRFNRYWFTLKGNVLSYYTDPSTPYFPRGNIDLRRGVSAELVPSKDNSQTKALSVTTDERTYYFKADSEASAKEWLRQIQRSIFMSHNDGDSVKISLPIDNILDVEESPVIDLAETVKIKVIDNDETFAVDEYFFSFFSVGKDVLNVLKIMTRDTMASKALAEREPPAAATASPSRSRKLLRGKRHSAPIAQVEGISSTSRSSSAGDQNRDQSVLQDQTRTSLDRPESGRRASPIPISSPARQIPRSSAVRPVSLSRDSSSVVDEFDEHPSDLEAAELSESGSRILGGSRVFRDPTLAVSSSRRRIDVEDQSAESTPSSRSVSPGRRGHDLSSIDDTQPIGGEVATTSADRPQSSSYTDSLSGFMRAGSNPIMRATNLLKDQSRRVNSLLGTSPRGYYEKVYGMWAGGKKHYADIDGLHGEDYVYDPEEEADTAQAEVRFRQHFALPPSEKLVATYFAHILRVLPLYGKIYIGSTKLCFRSLLPGTRTKLVIPFKDILNVDKEKGFRFGYSGMVTVIRGYEEIFFEFNTSDLRDDCTITVLRSLESLKVSIESTTVSEAEKLDAEKAAAENIILQQAREGEGRTHDLELPRQFGDSEHGIPPILFDDTEASVLDFKPSEPLAITCLTIGSRGDVQPYIALCKGFLAEGHKPKIATHAEFEPWIRKHGIDFAPVEGDPAELMRICVDNGMFTPSFLYEANSKFRGFLDTLLTSAWTACQGSDVLIESPSAMAGIHIAEALRIPYFRAFTMPWTRTRAYPHAFAVPNHKMGGAYNYMTYVLFDNVFWQSTAGQINRWRRKVLNLRPTTLDRLQPNKVPFLYNFSPSVVVPPLDFSDWIRVTGYWFLDEATTWTPPADLVAFIAKARADNVPLVYIGFGSVVVSDSRALTQAIIKAVQKADVRCILSKGWSDRLDRASQSLPDIPLPSCIHPISSAPHDWLFARIDAAVHHGGAGTTGACLRAGIPTVIKPFFGDQFFFAARVHDLGVGACIRRISEQVLGRALWIATHDARMRNKAKLLGEQIRAEDGVGTAIKAVYRDLEYARTLVERRAGAAAATKEPGSESWTLVGEEGESEAEEDEDEG